MPENKMPQPDSEGLSGTKLLEFLKEVSGHAEKEVSRVSGLYKIAAACVTVIVLSGIYSTFKDTAEFREKTHNDIKEQRQLIKEEMDHQERQMHDRQEFFFSQMQSSLSQQVTILSQKVEKKVDEEFRTENITKLVNDKAQGRIDLIADQLITDKIAKKIQPKIDEADKSLKLVKDEVQLAHDSVRKIQNTSEFLFVVSSAQNDDRQSFDKLKSWSDNPKFERNSDASQAWTNIVNEHDLLLTLSPYDVPWSQGIDPLKLSFEALRNAYLSARPYEVRVGILQYIWTRKNISKKQKMSLMIEAMRNDKSLRVVMEASVMFQSESHQKIKRLLVDRMFDWWEKNKDTISDKPESEFESDK